MPNIHETIDLIAAESLTILTDQLVITQLCARDVTSEFNTRPNGYKVGDTVRIATGADYQAKEFTGTVEVQAIRNSSRSMTIEKLFDVSVEIGAKELVMDFDNFTTSVIRPAMLRLAEKVDTYVGTKILNAQGLYVSDALFGNAADMAQARKAAQKQQLGPNRFCVMDLDLEATLLGKDFNQFNTRGQDGADTLRTGELGQMMGMSFFASNQFPTVTRTSSSGSTITDNSGGANVVGNKVLKVDAITGGFTAGDRIQIAGVRRPLIVASNAAADATSIALLDPITEIIPDNAAVTVVGAGQSSTIHGSIFDSQSLAVAFPMLEIPPDKPAAVLSENGVSIRVTQGYDMNTKTNMMSLDLLVGAEAFDPRRITLLGDY